MEDDRVTIAFGGELKRARDCLGISQMQLGERVGVSGKTVCLWEQGKQQPGVRILDALFNALKADHVQRLVWIKLLGSR